MAASCFRSLPPVSSLETLGLPAAWQCREGQDQVGGSRSGGRNFLSTAGVVLTPESTQSDLQEAPRAGRCRAA